MKQLLIISGLLLFSPLFLKSQINIDLLLAQEFYLNEEYDKAVVLYEKLFDRDPNSLEIYHNYLNTLLELERYKKAEKIVKTRIKSKSRPLSCYVDLGQVYAISGNKAKAATQYNKAINLLSNDKILISNLANAFIIIEEYDYALKVYQKGQKLFLQPGIFSFEIASVYEKKGEYRNMILVYLNYLEHNPTDIQSVKNELQKSLKEKTQFDELQSQLYKRIQKNPNIIIYTELLVWHLIQKKDYENAFFQVRALDKRLHENGMRVLNLAGLAVKDKAYDAAIKAFQYIIEVSKDDFSILRAKSSLLNCKKAKIINTTDYSENELISLKKEYKKLIADYGINVNTAEIVEEYADLEALYLHNLDSAVMIIEDLIKLRGLGVSFIAHAKLILGDYYLMKGEVWESTLLYSQVSKAIKDGPMGELARFKNAKLSYYRGDFEWAQAQLEVLQASTSELIANDALQLFIFIQDHLALDTITIPMLMFAEADLLVFQNRDNEAMVMLDSIKQLFPGHMLLDDVINLQASIHVQNRNYAEAAILYSEIITDYSYEVLADDALFKLARLYEEKLNDKKKAMELYQQLIIEYAGSIWVVDSRKRFRELRGDQVN